MQVDIRIRLKSGVLSPESIAVKDALNRMGFTSVTEVSVSKLWTLEVQVEDKAKAASIAAEVCEKLLRNPVLENYTIVIDGKEVKAVEAEQTSWLGSSR